MLDALMVAVVGGIVGGLISPFAVLWLQHKWIWKSQRKIELRNSIFDDAVRALSQYAADALDPKIQAEKASYQGSERKVEVRPETLTLMEKAQGMVQAFFSREAFEVLDKALRTSISIETVPNSDFEKARTEAIRKLANELGLGLQRNSGLQ